MRSGEGWGGVVVVGGDGGEVCAVDLLDGGFGCGHVCCAAFIYGAASFEEGQAL